MELYWDAPTAAEQDVVLNWEYFRPALVWTAEQGVIIP